MMMTWQLWFLATKSENAWIVIPSYRQSPSLEMVEIASNGKDPCDQEPFIVLCRNKLSICVSHCIFYREHVYGSARGLTLTNMLTDDDLITGIIKEYTDDVDNPAYRDVFDGLDISRSTPAWCGYNPVDDSCLTNIRANLMVNDLDDLHLIGMTSSWQDSFKREVYSTAFWFSEDERGGRGPVDELIALIDDSDTQNVVSHCSSEGGSACMSSGGTEILPASECSGLWRSSIDKSELEDENEWLSWTGLDAQMMIDYEPISYWDVSCW
eukprot:GHVH01000709.1.p1 GENE.GHVH01000709.1~~GHVH01000709.1.p1  ORF type:complete len:268 (+),score=36.71 GHVH01000709.1:1062-1865(+)